MKKPIIYFFLFVFGIVGAQAQQVQDIVENYLLQQREQSNIVTNDVTFKITSEHVSTLSGIHHIYFTQTYNNLQILGTESALHIKSGAIYGNDIKLLTEVNNKANTTSPSISAINAIEQAANSQGYRFTTNLNQIKKNNNEYVFSDGGISLRDIPVKLAYFNIDDEIRLIWDLSIEEKRQQHWYNFQIDATTGDVVSKKDWMIHCKLDHEHSNDHKEILNYNSNLVDIPNYKVSENNSQGCSECYEVFAIPLESPYFGSRTIETMPSDADASPFGWHDIDGVDGAEFTTTRGNNVNAYEDGDNEGYQPDGGELLNFTGYPFNENYSIANQFEDAAITNLFYWNNVIHDILYQYGFDAKSGNFQENNYSEGGEDSDSVNAEAQDSSGECNANFGTPPDGFNPRMQMYTCGDKDGDFDNLVIIHEYGHGISNRLTGGAMNVNCLFGNEQMGEGWSDYYGVMLTMTEDQLPEDPTTVGTYLFNQGIDGEGIRPFPYSTDLSVNPHTYDDIKAVSVPHGVGSVWAAMLWDMTWNLIEAHGFSNDFATVTGDVTQDAGNIQALLLVTEALKLQPCAPGFVDGRDAILAADIAIYGGANECLIWDAFAKRGLGISATQGSSDSNLDGIEAFDIPSSTATFTAPADLCLSGLIDANVTGGIPFGGIYSGPGVTDNGNGFSYTFDPNASGVGVHTIVYQIENGTCAVASQAMDTIEVFAAPEGPTTTSALLVCLNEEVTLNATLNDPNNIINWFDSIDEGNFLGAGTSYTFTPTQNTTIYAQELPQFDEGQLKISEIGLLAPDGFEITNIGAAKDYSGYKVAISDVPFDNINAVNGLIRELDFIAANTTIYFNDLSQSANFWGNNISWSDGGHGWIIILDPDNNVVDSVFWNTTAQEIDTFNITIDGTTIDVSDLDWTGPGADFSEECNASFRRIGDNDTASNWSSDCITSDFGTFNTDMQLGFQGCLSQRVPAMVTGEQELPIINCPENMTVTQSAQSFEMPDFTIDANASDNCSFTVTQSPSVGQNLPAGFYLVTLTATDGAGNTSSCSFTLDAILNVDDIALENQIALIPNPSFGNIQLIYNGQEALKSIELIDVNGRLIKRVNPSTADITNFSLAELADGFYFVKIQAGTTSIVKQVIKK